MALSTPAMQNTTLYFGYGSNLWLNQMTSRCPTSTYSGVARLPSYRWQINTRGYANIVESNTTVTGNPYKNVVFGLVYTLQPSDEARLDKNEGVPIAYTKEDLEVDFWASSDAGVAVDVEGERPRRRRMLVYINREEVADDVPRFEYIHRMNMGIRDALSVGVPGEYVEKVMRKFIPEDVEMGMGQVPAKQQQQQQVMESNEE